MDDSRQAAMAPTKATVTPAAEKKVASQIQATVAKDKEVLLGHLELVSTKEAKAVVRMEDSPIVAMVVDTSMAEKTGDSRKAATAGRVQVVKQLGLAAP